MTVVEICGSRCGRRTEKGWCEDQKERRGRSTRKTRKRTEAEERDGLRRRRGTGPLSLEGPVGPERREVSFGWERATASTGDILGFGDRGPVCRTDSTSEGPSPWR